MKKILTALCLGLCVASCDDVLDTMPETTVSSGNMWTSENYADKGIAGLWRPFYNTASTMKINDLTGLNRPGTEALGFATTYHSNGRSVRLLTDATKSATDWLVKHEWEFCYTIIHACNDAVANLHKASDMAPEKMERYYCEARFMRAWAYTRLNMYFQGVPIYLEPVSNAECTRSQSTADEVWKIIIDDLDLCIANKDFPDNTLTTNYGRPSKGAAYALRGNAKMWTGDYTGAAADFAEVEKCGYGLWEGEYSDIFTYANMRNKEMILTLQFDNAPGYYDKIQLALGCRDAYDSWDEILPAADFVDSFRNADGSVFRWEDVPGLEDWNKLTPKQREVFFLRDGLESRASVKKTVVGRIGDSIYKKYYLNKGNEARIRAAYENRDPRLKQIVLTPYTPINAYNATLNGGKTMINKEMRWPLVTRGTNGGDLWPDCRQATTSIYLYKKFVCWEKGEIEARDKCYNDWPLIRYTDVLLARAEALTRTGDIDGAIALVNKVRARAHMPALTNGGAAPNGVSGSDEMLERIRYERRIEMCVEGVDFFDEMRWGTYKESKFQGKDQYAPTNWWGDAIFENWYYTENMWPLSAPSTEIQKNPSLNQRPGWAY